MPSRDGEGIDKNHSWTPTTMIPERTDPNNKNITQGTPHGAERPAPTVAPPPGGVEDLARWAWSRLVNRQDAWGGYHPLCVRGRAYTRPDGSGGKIGTTTTRPRRRERGRVLLTEQVLVRHFFGLAVEDVVGLHAVSPMNTSRSCAVDIDYHSPDSTAPDVNLAAALAWYGRLLDLGITPLLVDSNGIGGYHLWAIFAEPIPSTTAHTFIRWLVGDHARHGLPAAPETFPKQAAIPQGRYGNWLRLPGRHHTRDHWSRVWDGGHWLDGAGAAAHLLRIAGSSPACIPAGLPVPSVRVPVIPRSGPIARPPEGALSRRIAAYLRRLPNLAEGQGRDDVAYGFAAWLVRDLQLDDEIALLWLRKWDGGNRPPKGEARLREILASARTYGQHPVGSGLASGEIVRPGHNHESLEFTFHVEGAR